MYATRTRDHDALWYLQMTLVTNDMQVAAARRGKKPIRKHVEDLAPSPQSDPDEAAAAIRAVCRIGEQTGLDAAAQLEVLEALGLLGAEAPRPVEPWTPGIVVLARPAGICRSCHRSIYLRKNGTVMRHSAVPHLPAGDTPCPGSHNKPRSEAAR